MKCPNCKLETPDAAMRCVCGWDFSVGMLTAANLGAEPSSGVSGVRLASLSERFIGQILDSLVAVVLVVAAFIIASFLRSIGPVVVLSAFGFAILYLIFADGLSGGQSYGKRIMKTAVIDMSSGQPCTFMKSFIRNILLSLLGIIDWIFIFGVKRQRLGDMAANTIVVKLRDR